MSQRKRTAWLRAGAGALLLAGLCLQAARADFELSDATGRRILLKDDGTWSYVEPPAGAASGVPDAVDVPVPQAEMRLERRVDAPGGCRFDVSLSNPLVYEIRSLVPEFTVYRANDVPYATRTTDFGPLRPGDSSLRTVRFRGIGCDEVGALKVSGGDRCAMDDLNKFSEPDGRCLARVRVLSSDLLTFEKGK